MNEFSAGTSRRRFLQIGAVTGAALLLPETLAACSPSPSNSKSKSNVLVVAALTTPANIDQDLDTSAQSHEVRMNTMERLMAYALEPSPQPGVQQENFKKIEPRLAERWTVNADQTEITFNLRQGVTSPWGNTMDAEDVKWTWDRAWALNAVGSFYLRSVLRMTQPNWKVLDKHTIRLTVPNPSPVLPTLWINMDLGIFDSKEAKKHATSDDPWARKWIAQNSPSFGPYQVTTWSPGSQVVLTAWAKHYRGAPSIGRVVFQQVPESSNRLSLVNTGAAQIAEDLSPRDFATGAKPGKVKAVSLSGNAIYRVEFDNKSAPFDKSLVRQALNYAVDRKAMIDGPFAGLADVCKSPLPPTYPGYTGEFFKFSHDVAKAKALLAQAGYSKGFSATLSYRADSAVEDQMARAIQTSLGEVGVQLSLSKQASSTYLQNILTHKFPMYLYVDSSILPNPSYALNLWLNSSSAIDYSRYENAQVNKSINEMLTTLDESKGLELAKQVQELVMQDPPWIYLVNPGYHVLLSSNVDGFAWRTPINPIEYRNLTLS